MDIGELAVEVQAIVGAGRVELGGEAEPGGSVGRGAVERTTAALDAAAAQQLPT